jgi:hypothetical protein
VKLVITSRKNKMNKRINFPTFAIKFEMTNLAALPIDRWQVVIAVGSNTILFKQLNTMKFVSAAWSPSITLQFQQLESVQTSLSDFCKFPATRQYERYFREFPSFSFNLRHERQRQPQEPWRSLNTKRNSKNKKIIVRMIISQCFDYINRWGTLVGVLDGLRPLGLLCLDILAAKIWKWRCFRVGRHLGKIFRPLNFPVYF